MLVKLKKLFSYEGSKKRLQRVDAPSNFLSSCVRPDVGFCLLGPSVSDIEVSHFENKILKK